MSRKASSIHGTVRRLGVLEGDASEVRGADDGPRERELPGLPQSLELQSHLESEERRLFRGRGRIGGAGDGWYLGSVDRVGGDELLDVGVGPLGERFGAAVDLLEVVEEGEVARPVLLHALEVLTDPHRRRRPTPFCWIRFGLVDGEVVAR
jgi:hypothetical protein